MSEIDERVDSSSKQLESDNDSGPLNQLVYVPDSKDGYALGRIFDLDTKHVTIRLEQPRTGDVKVEFTDIWPAVDDLNKDVNDNCSLMYLNEATLLHNCRLRYNRKQIYSYVANILISINPYEQLEGLYSTETIQQYRGKSLGMLPPHIFAIADKAYRDMKRNSESQSIVVSGESGSGKTECQKYVLRYLCENWSSEGAKHIEKLILNSNPILEAFGNAKTARNNNSSRFGKFVEIHFNNKHTVVGGFVSHYLLEKSRVTTQAADERNYHVFFQLIAGADQNLTEKLGLMSPDKFNYLNKGCTQFFRRGQVQANANGFLVDEILDDAEDFKRLCEGLSDIGIKGEDQVHVFSLLAAILHLGNIAFESSEELRGGCIIKNDTIPSLEKAAELLGLNPQELFLGLTTRLMQPTRSGALGTLIQVRLKADEARAATDALAKAIYSRLFDYIVAAINKAIPFGDSCNFIGVLDIAGFEFFKTNSLEQFNINYCNEKLQAFFNDHVLKSEQELYALEGLGVPKVEYETNDDCIALFEQKGTGLIDLLNEESKLPRGTSQQFTVKAQQANKSNKCLIATRTSKEFRSLKEDQAFLVRHYSNDVVCYETEQFLIKNTDALHSSLETMMESSTNPLITKLFTVENSQLGGASPLLVKNKLVNLTVSFKFRSQLQLLIQKLNSTGTHFVRCIKPNMDMAPAKFDGGKILSQLRSAGMESVLRLMQSGFPCRTTFADLHNRYSKASSPLMSRLDGRLFCKCIFYSLGLNEFDYRFGTTKVFFRAGKFKQFDDLMRNDNVEELIQKAQSWLNRFRWKKAIYTVLSCIKIKKIHEEKIIRLEAQRLAEELMAKQKMVEEEAAKLVAQQTLIVEQEAKKEEEAKKMTAEKSTQSTVYDVQSWSYAKLRDAINTETVIDLLEACRLEFRRRLASYRAFKLANAKYKHTPQ